MHLGAASVEGAASVLGLPALRQRAVIEVERLGKPVGLGFRVSGVGYERIYFTVHTSNSAFRSHAIWASGLPTVLASGKENTANPMLTEKLPVASLAPEALTEARMAPKPYKP